MNAKNYIDSSFGSMFLWERGIPNGLIFRGGSSIVWNNAHRWLDFRGALHIDKGAFSRNAFMLLFFFIALLSSLHLFSGYADNGDFYRNVAFLFEKPLGFSTMSPSPDTAEWANRYWSQWHDRWVLLSDIPNFKDIVTYSSYQIYLYFQVKFFSWISSGSEYYSLIAGSLLSRILYLATFFCFLCYVRKTVNIFAFWVSFAVCGSIILDVNFGAFFNSFYEEQIAIIFLPILAFLLYSFYYQKNNNFIFLLLLVSTFIGAAKTAYFYLPFLLAFFLAPSLYRRNIFAKFIILSIFCQIISFLPVFFGKYGNINQYHSVYIGALTVLDEDEIREINKIGEKPILVDCIGVQAFFQKGHSCMERASANYSDVIKLVYHHPYVATRMVRAVIEKGGQIEIYLGKKMSGVDNFSNIPLFNLWKVVFLKNYNFAFLLISFASIFLYIFFKFSNTSRAMLLTGIFLSFFGFSQYVAALGDGFGAIEKHLIGGNYALALSAAFIFPALLQVIYETFVSRKVSG